MTYGLILVFEELRSLLVGDDVHGVQAPELLSGSIALGSVPPVSAVTRVPRPPARMAIVRLTCR